MLRRKYSRSKKNDKISCQIVVYSPERPLLFEIQELIQEIAGEGDDSQAELYLLAHPDILFHQYTDTSEAYDVMILVLPPDKMLCQRYIKYLRQKFKLSRLIFITDCQKSGIKEDNYMIADRNGKEQRGYVMIDRSHFQNRLSNELQAFF